MPLLNKRVPARLHFLLDIIVHTKVFCSVVPPYSKVYGFIETTIVLVVKESRSTLKLNQKINFIILKDTSMNNGNTELVKIWNNTKLFQKVSVPHKTRIGSLEYWNLVTKMNAIQLSYKSYLKTPSITNLLLHKVIIEFVKS